MYGDMPDGAFLELRPDLIDPDDLVGRQMTARIRKDRTMRYVDINDQHPLGDPRWAQAFLDQGDLWCDATGTYLDIPDMEASHARNCVSLLMRAAPTVALSAALNESGRNGTDEEAIAWQEIIADPVKARRWLLETTLVRALLAQAAVSGIVTPPWQTRRRLVHVSLR